MLIEFTKLSVFWFWFSKVVRVALGAEAGDFPTSFTAITLNLGSEDYYIVMNEIRSHKVSKVFDCFKKN